MTYLKAPNTRFYDILFNFNTDVRSRENTFTRKRQIKVYQNTFTSKFTSDRLRGAHERRPAMKFTRYFTRHILFNLLQQQVKYNNLAISLRI